MRHLSALLALLCAPLFSIAQLTGTRTVGGTSPDYATITAAVDALMSQGATGNVTFNIRPGTYTGQYVVGPVPGAPGTITFRNETNGAQAVNLEYDANSTTDNFIFRLEGAQGVVLEKLTFRPLDYDHARAVHFINGLTGLTIEQCVFHGSTNPSGSASFERILVHCDQFTINTDNNPQDVLILDNSFFNGNTAIELDAYGFNGARSAGLIISGNEFRQQVGTGIRLNHCIGSIGDNAFSTTVGNWYVGIRTTFFDGGSQIRRNDIQAYATNGCTGIEVGNTQSTTGNMISNNMVYVNGTGDVWGLAVYNLWDMKIVHNSVLVAAGNQFQSYAFHHLSNFPDGQDALVRNNIFANNAGGYAYYVPVAANVAIEDHNDLFTTGSTISNVAGNEYLTIPAHQAGTGQGAGDTDIDPVFPIQPDLHLNNCAMDSMGEYFFVVASDIDGDARGNPLCDMGADEYTASTNAMQAPTITILSSDLPYQLGLGASFNAYQWSTGDNTPTTTITAGGTYSCDVLDANFCSFSINITVVVNINTGVAEAANPDAVLFPNPAMETITVSGAAAGAAYTLIDASGRVLREGRLPTTAMLDVRDLSPGVHVLRLLDGGSVRTARFVKQ
ncbi:MAG TPA: T9SS type A sorting domain-containing protein [Flavobacteriales bacterium]|nr:T9SS type A sorting domain-containing protein [Flavobacteriales bacterium]HMR26139.1 T9SS type A sorting domain-containing protein [Flavobacteriales bacterium]